MKITFNAAEAAEATGVSVDVIRRAVRAGDIATVTPLLNGKPMSKWLIPAAELARWAGVAA